MAEVHPHICHPPVGIMVVEVGRRKQKLVEWLHITFSEVFVADIVEGMDRLVELDPVS